MTRIDVLGKAFKCGWKVWGRLRRVHGSSYQCFRRRNMYLWIGLRYLERSDIPHSFDFVSDNEVNLKEFLE